jgi:hypothetical protein
MAVTVASAHNAASHLLFFKKTSAGARRSSGEGKSELAQFARWSAAGGQILSEEPSRCVQD